MQQPEFTQNFYVSVLRSSWQICFAIAAILFLSNFSAVADSKNIDTTRFGTILIKLPEQQATKFALLFSNKSGISQPELDTTNMLNSLGYGVAIINSASYLSKITSEPEDCFSPAGEIVRLSQMVEIEAGIQSFSDPILIGLGFGANIAYLVAKESSNEFAGLITFGYAVTNLEPVKSCLQDFSTNPEDTRWVQFQTDNKENASAIKSFLNEIHIEESVNNSAIADALIELPCSKDTQDYFVILLSGDGGWATLDKEIGESLVKAGIDVLGFNSLKYFWQAKDKELAAKDLEISIKHYLAKWNKRKVVLIGFSLGADVLPLIFNKLNDEVKKNVSNIVLLSPGLKGALEMHITDWFFDASDRGEDLLPEIERFKTIPTLCVYGSEEDETVCRQVVPSYVKKIELPGNHHFDDDYERVAQLILNSVSNNEKVP